MPYIYIVHVYQYQISQIMIEFYLTITVVVFFSINCFCTSNFIISHLLEIISQTGYFIPFGRAILSHLGDWPNLINTVAISSFFSFTCCVKLSSFQFISLKRCEIAVHFLCVKILDNYFWCESWWQSLYLGFLDLTLTPFPMLLDNYAYILKDSKSAVVVDPGDPEPVIVSFLPMSNTIISCI